MAKTYLAKDRKRLKRKKHGILRKVIGRHNNEWFRNANSNLGENIPERQKRVFGKSDIRMYKKIFTKTVNLQIEGCWENHRSNIFGCYAHFVADLVDMWTDNNNCRKLMAIGYAFLA